MGGILLRTSSFLILILLAFPVSFQSISLIGLPVNLVTGASVISITASSPHGPINITSDAEFNSQGWPGVGSQADPYIISNLEISALDDAIKISNTLSHFKIENCVISSIETRDAFTGVKLSNVENGVIANCTIKFKDTAISISDSYQCTVANNTISDSDFGVVIDGSDYCVVEENQIKDPQEGVYLDSCDSCDVVNNHIFNCTDYPGTIVTGYGVNFRYSYNCYAGYNTIHNGEFGIEIAFSELCIASSNLIYKMNMDGIGFFADDHSRAYHNRLYGRSSIYVGGVSSDSIGTQIVNNTLCGDGFGFWITSLDNGLILNNTILGTSVGIDIVSSSSGNDIYGNIIGWSQNYNAEDDSEGNFWDDGVSVGNAWSDYNETELYYYIDGDTGGIDHFPELLVDNTAPNPIISGIPETISANDTVNVRATVDDITEVFEGYLSYTYHEAFWRNISMEIMDRNKPSDLVHWIGEIPELEEGRTIQCKVYLVDFAGNWFVSDTFSYNILNLTTSSTTGDDESTQLDFGLVLILGGGIVIVALVVVGVQKKRK